MDAGPIFKIPNSGYANFPTFVPFKLAGTFNGCSSITFVAANIFAPLKVKSPIPILLKLTSAPPFTASFCMDASLRACSTAIATTASIASPIVSLLTLKPPAPSVGVFAPPMVISPADVAIFKSCIETPAASVVFKLTAALASNIDKSVVTGRTPAQFSPVLHTASISRVHETFAADALTANIVNNGHAQICFLIKGC